MPAARACRNAASPLRKTQGGQWAGTVNFSKRPGAAARGTGYVPPIRAISYWHMLDCTCIYELNESR